MRAIGSRAPAWVPPPGTIVANRYRLGAPIGVGGMGCVCEAERLFSMERVAIKFLAPEGQEAETTHRFFREAKAAARLESEHVVKVLDVGAAEGVGPFIVMERLDGEDLAELLARRGAMSVGQAVTCILQTCEALSRAHAAGIVHRDVKPSNLFAAKTPDGRVVVKVLDFGISKMSGDVHPMVTTTQATFGSPAYMAPEQVRSAKHVDHRADIWSVGVVLHELLTGQLPFSHDSASAILAAIIADAPTPLRSHRRELPEELERIVLRCLEKDRAARFQSTSELAAALAPFADAAVSSASSAFTARAFAPTMRMPRSRAWIVALVGMIAVTSIIAGWAVRTRREIPRAPAVDPVSMLPPVDLPPAISIATAPVTGQPPSASAPKPKPRPAAVVAQPRVAPSASIIQPAPRNDVTESRL